MDRSRYQILNELFPYFHTATVMGWQLMIFTRQDSVPIVLNRFTWLQNNTDFQLYADMILENHLHFMATATPPNQRI